MEEEWCWMVGMGLCRWRVASSLGRVICSAGDLELSFGGS